MDEIFSGALTLTLTLTLTLALALPEPEPEPEPEPILRHGSQLHARVRGDPAAPRA